MKRLKTMPLLKYASAGLVVAFFSASCEPLPLDPGDRRPYRTAADREREGYERPYNQNRRGGIQDDRDGFQRDPEPPRQTRDSYPTAERTANPNQVLSPYKPYNVIDVEGFRSGQLAKDPSNGQIFRVP